jgi:hypothetical protein
MSDAVIWRVDPQQRNFFEQVLVPAGCSISTTRRSNRPSAPDAREHAVPTSARRDDDSHARPAAQALSKVLLKDPLQLHEFLLDQLAAPGRFRRTRTPTPFSRRRKALLIRIRGRRPVNDLEFAKKFTATIDTLARRVNATITCASTSPALTRSPPPVNARSATT